MFKQIIITSSLLMGLSGYVYAGSAVENALIADSTYTIVGTFGTHDFSGVDTAFDWAFTTADGASYQLQGKAASESDVFGWKLVSIATPTPKWHMFQLNGDVDGDGSPKFDWMLASVDMNNKALYKLAGVSATGNFMYEGPINFDYAFVGKEIVIASGSGGLTPQTVNAFVGMVSDELGCSFTATQAAPQRTLLSSEAISAVTKAVIAVKESDLVAYRTNLRETQTIPGDCGGSLVVTSTESGTTATGSYTFNNYCTGELTGANTVVNGALGMTVSQSGSAYTIAASTSTPLHVTTTNPGTSETVDVTLSLSGGTLTINPDGGMSLGASSVTIADNTENTTYTLTNLSATVGADGATTFAATYNDAQMGTVTATGNVNTSGQGTINITGANGATATLTSTATAGVYTVSTNGSGIGTLDCSNIDTSGLGSLL